MMCWVLHCVACDRKWPVYRDHIGKQDRACVYCGAGGVRVERTGE